MFSWERVAAGGEYSVLIAAVLLVVEGELGAGPGVFESTGDEMYVGVVSSEEGVVVWMILVNLLSKF